MQEAKPPRLLAPGPNVCNLVGVSCVPWYLGMAPAEYVDPQFAMPPIPKSSEANKPLVATADLIEWLSRSGVTHVLNFEPLDHASWKVELVWSGVDPFLNRVWGRQEPIYLYRFRENPADEVASFPGRVYATDPQVHIADNNWTISKVDTRRIDWESDRENESTLILTELAFPGWTARQGAQELDVRTSGMFRSVEIKGNQGEIDWTYRPLSVYAGALISLVTLISLASIAHVRFWHPQFLNRLLCKACLISK
jgi:hypothetical protein